MSFKAMFGPDLSFDNGMIGSGGEGDRCTKLGAGFGVDGLL